MANVFDSASYAINEVNNHHLDGDDFYQVVLQRYPVDTYPDKTYHLLQMNVTIGSDTEIKFPSGLAKADFLSNALPKVNAFITAIDASTTSSSFS